MATYNTVPDDETSSLQNKPETKSLKYIVAGAAAASFLIGVALATATTAGVAAQQQPSFKTEYAPDFFNIGLASDHSKCLAANGKGDALTVIDCKKHEGQFKKGRNDDGTYVLTSNGDCVSVLRGSAQSVGTIQTTEYKALFTSTALPDQASIHTRFTRSPYGTEGSRRRQVYVSSH